MRHGFLLIDKPEGPTSHDCVARVRSVLGEKKIGHLGTLDPAASGLLVLAVGAKALKVVELFSDLSKQYEAGICLGKVSSTYDREGVIEEVTLKPGQSVPVQTDIQNEIADYFTGKISQVPPEHSAVKVGGTRAYRKARQGEAVEMKAREVHITTCTVTSYDYPSLTLRVDCGSGTYIRSLAHDLGHKLRCGGYLSSLRRTKVGEWLAEDAVEPDRAAWGHVIPLKEVMRSFTSIDLSDAEADDISHGRDIERRVEPNTIAWHKDLPIAIVEPVPVGMAHARKVL